MTTLLFAADFHGNAASYDAAFEKAVWAPADAVILGGDLLPLPTRAGDPFLGQKEFAEEWLAPRIRTFRKEHPEIQIFGLLGNDDWAGCIGVLEALEEEGAMSLLHMKSHKINGDHAIAGYSCVPVTPFGMSDFDRFDSATWKPPQDPVQVLLSGPEGIRTSGMDELRARPTIEVDLEELAKLSNPAKTVYVTHSPPWNTKLDTMRGRVSIGSPAVRRFIEKYQPPLTLHGHIHESPELSSSIFDVLGKTVCINPGASKTLLRAACVAVDHPAGSLRLVTAD
jgi:Icc-related predicted phosphoesterase